MAVRALMPGIFALIAGIAVVLTPALRIGQDQPRSARTIEGGPTDKRDGFTFCRLIYTSTREEPGGNGWSTDYPGADRNLMIRLSELTLSDITRFDSGAPAPAVVRAEDPALFQCPFLFASDVGTLGWNDAEIETLRRYFAKGGFLWVDDFWGNRAWSQWVLQIRRVLPDYPVVDLPMSYELFSTFYFIEKVPQIPSIQFWRRSGGGTSERGAESAVPRVAGIFDKDGRLLVVMTHNTDIADGWEREGEDFEFFHLFSPRGYSVGVNVAIWSMTH